MPLLRRTHQQARTTKRRQCKMSVGVAEGECDFVGAYRRADRVVRPYGVRPFPH